jgi:hypothetical protein
MTLFKSVVCLAVFPIGLLFSPRKTLKPLWWLEIQKFDVWYISEDGELQVDSKIAEFQSYLDRPSLVFRKRLTQWNQRGEDRYWA